MKLPADVHKIIIFRALQLGDMLCFVPALRALRKAHPEAEITLVGLPWAKSFTERFDQYIDKFINFPGYPGLPEQIVIPAKLTAFLANVQAINFDLALQMQGNGYLVNPMVELFGAKFTAGFCKPDDYCPNSNYFMEYPEYGPEPERHLKLMSFLGISSDSSDLEFPLTNNDYWEYQKLNLPVHKKKYVCIHPGSRGGWRQWPVEYFANIADACKRSGFEVVFTGTTEETEIINRVIAKMNYEPTNTAGKTNLGAVGVLIKNAALLISNCTGVSHMASALKTPSVVISMDGEPERWAPINKQLHYTINWLLDPDYQKVLQRVNAFLYPIYQA